MEKLNQKVSWLYVDMNSFFASCEQQVHPHLRGRPVAVVPSMVETTSVIAASYEAKAFGVKTGVKVAEARKMCPDILFTTGHHDVYIRFHHLVREAIETCIPVEKTCSIDEFACRLTGTQQELSKAVSIGYAIQKVLAEKVGVSITASIGIAPSRFLAKIACDMKKPNGLTTITLNDLPHKLYSLKLNDIPGVGYKMHARLQQAGIHKVEELLKLPEQHFHAIWGGVWGSRMHAWLQGKDFEPPRTTTSSIGHQHVLPPSLRNYEGSFMIAKKLLNKAAIRMRKDGYYARRLSLSVKMLGTEKTYFENSISFQETKNTLVLMRKLQELWQPLTKKIRPLRISITLSNIILQDQHQYSFFENPKLDQISETMDKINKKFGREFIHLGSLHEAVDSAPTRIAFQRIPDLDEC